jgi:hypothetical protein
MVSVVKRCSNIALSIGVLHISPVLIHENLVRNEVLDRMENILVVDSDAGIVVPSPHIQRDTLPDRGIHYAVEV